VPRVWHPYTRFSTLTGEDMPVITGGEGCYLHVADGNRYLDAIASWWCVNLGHGRREIIEAIQRQADQLQHSILGNLTHPLAIELADELAALMPTPDRHVLFASDGSSAIEQAVKIAIQYRANTGETGRQQIACLDGAYHGDTLGAMALGYLEHFHKPYEKHLFPALRLPFPACRCVQNGPGCAATCFAEAKKLLNQHAGTLTAVIVEPLLQGAGGMRIHGEAWLRSLSAWCREHGVLLILDEIATGFGRTGDWFAFRRAGIDPDIVCVGKGLAAGYLPISATIVRDGIYETFSDVPVDHTLQHGHTFCGNPIAAAAALAALAIYRDGVIAEVPRKGRLLAEALSPARAHERVKEMRSLGLMTALELHPEDVSGASISLPHRIRLHLKERGILLRPLGNVLYAMPPLTISDDEIELLGREMVSALSVT
jgi:adenosylmethionine---8-amino-7-oxononanoate aminotransferase